MTGGGSSEATNRSISARSGRRAKVDARSSRNQYGLGKSVLKDRLDSAFQQTFYCSVRVHARRILWLQSSNVVVPVLICTLPPTRQCRYLAAARLCQNAMRPLKTFKYHPIRSRAAQGRLRGAQKAVLEARALDSAFAVDNYDAGSSFRVCTDSRDPVVAYEQNSGPKFAAPCAHGKHSCILYIVYVGVARLRTFRNLKVSEG